MGYQAIILAAGRGSRMGDLGNRIPKALLPVGDKPIIGHQLCMLGALGVTEAHVVVGHRASDIERSLGDGGTYGVRLNYLVQAQQLGIAHAVGMLRRTVREPFFLLLGDYFFVADEPQRMLAQLDRGASAILAKREADIGSISDSCELRLSGDNLVSELIEKPTRPRSHLKGCGFYALQPDIFDYISRTPRTCLRDEYELTISLDMFARDGNRLHAEVMTVWDQNFTYPSDVLGCNMRWLQSKNEPSFFSSSAVIHPNTEFVNVVVGSEARIDSGARLSDVVVFPGARVEAGATIQHALATPRGVVPID